MFEMLEKLKLDDEYAIINRNSENSFVILEGGGPLIFDRLRMIPKEQFEFEKFCKEFSQEMGVRIEEIKEDVNLVLEVLKYEETDTIETDGKSVISDNTYAYVYDYFNRKNKIFKVFMEMTYGCNLKCRHCYLGTDINHVQTRFTLEKAKSILDELKEAGVVEVTFTGGEIFSYPHALEVIEYACDLKFLVTILTNGTLITEKIADKLTQLPISEIRISMYGTKEFHDRFVGIEGAFDKSLHALQKLNEKKKNFCMASSVVTNECVDSLLELHKMLENMGIRHRLTPLIYPTTQGDLSPTKLRISEEKIVELLHQKIFTYSGSECNSGISRLRISPLGEVNPCELFRNVSLGNLFEHSLKEILSSEERQSWIKFVREESQVGECQKCENRKYCPRCLGVLYLENGNIREKADGLCRLANAKVWSMKDESQATGTEV